MYIFTLTTLTNQKSTKRQVISIFAEAILISVVFQHSFNWNERKKKISCGQSTRIDQHLWLFGLRRFGPSQQEAHRREPSKSKSENLQMQSLVSMDGIDHHHWLIFCFAWQLHSPRMLDESQCLSTLQSYSCRCSCRYTWIPRYFLCISKATLLCLSAHW